MKGQYRYKSFLTQTSSGATSDSEHTQYEIFPEKTIVIGRDSRRCEIVLDTNQYPDVSREHVKISPLPSQSHSDLPLWEICDLESRNGTYVNGQRLKGCQILQLHDRIQLGLHGPEFILECQPASFISVTDLFPVVSRKHNLHQSNFLIPGLITIIFVGAMFATQSTPNFLYILAAYLTAASHYVIHKLCHKHKPWWLLVSVALATGLPLLTGFHEFTQIFSHLLPESLLKEHIFALVYEKVFVAGFLEELFKALPVLLVYVLGRLLPSPKRKLIGIWEPIDGILLATASATGFAIVEILMLVHHETQSKGSYAGVTLLIPLILGDIFGQVAYSGYFGYFIGLSALKPSKGWQLLGIGYLSSATLHSIGAVVSELQKEQTLDFLSGNLLFAFISCLAFLCLTAAILKARKLSSFYSQKFANVH
ncbi:MAG: PrsW family glutamic-type intramembrane protease [Scytonema sp. PMC 1069.18]|nr:PrsW family glutamic-type intramembrane protease [Scytonema sp. PMC 1069.18]MEC4883160.1 PrsW family glutamic-type intramembrane protease [Scytonema sp. PMC 1070.18]